MYKRQAQQRLEKMHQRAHLEQREKEQDAQRDNAEGSEPPVQDVYKRQLLNSMRQAVLHDVLRTAGAPFPLVCGAPYLEPYCFVQDLSLIHI